MGLGDFKIEIDGNDVSEWVIQNGSIENLTSEPIGGGQFFLSTECPFSFQNFDEVKLYFRVTSFVHLFTGLIRNYKEVKSKDYYKITVKNTSLRFAKKTATNKFRNDAGTGLATYIVKNLTDEYVPEISYTGASIPDDTYFFLEQAYQNKYINEVFDYMAEILGKQWWVDKDKILYLKTRTFDVVTTEITDDNLKRDLTIDYDTSKMANYIYVDGARITTQIKQVETITGTTNEVTLDYIPAAAVKVETGTTEDTMALEGVANYDSSYDVYVKVADKKIHKNSGNWGIGETVTIYYDIISGIHEELADGASIDSQGITIEKGIVNEEITKQDDAFYMADNYLKNYSLPLKLVTAFVQFTSQAQLSDWQVGKRIKVNTGGINEYFNCVGIEYSFGTKGIFARLRFTDFPALSRDLLKKLLLKIKQREEQDRKAITGLVKYFYWGGNVYFEIENVSIYKEVWDTGTTSGFILGHPDKGELGTDKLGAAVLSGTTPASFIEVINSARGFIDRFRRDQWFENTGSTDADYDRSGTEGYVFSSGSVYSSEYIEKAGNSYSRAWYSLTVEAGGTTDFTVKVFSDSSGTFQAIGTTPTSITTGSNFKYEMTYDGGGTVKATEISIRWD
jgi:hypothetical protein